MTYFRPGDRVCWRRLNNAAHIFHGTLVRALIGNLWVVDDGLDRPLRCVSEYRLTKVERFAPLTGGERS